MSTRRTRLVVASAFALALLGGATAGMIGARYVADRSLDTSTGRASLSDELQLGIDQRDHVRRIWEQVQQTLQDSYQQDVKLDKKREDALVALLNPEQLKRYQMVYAAYVDGHTALEARKGTLMRRAIEQTRKLLTPAQRLRYDAILDERLNGRIGAADEMGTDQSADFSTLAVPSTQP